MSSKKGPLLGFWLALWKFAKKVPIFHVFAVLMGILWGYNQNNILSGVVFYLILSLVVFLICLLSPRIAKFLGVEDPVNKE